MFIIFLTKNTLPKPYTVSHRDSVCFHTHEQPLLSPSSLSNNCTLYQTPTHAVFTLQSLFHTFSEIQISENQSRLMLPKKCWKWLKVKWLVPYCQTKQQTDYFFQGFFFSNICHNYFQYLELCNLYKLAIY